VSHELRTPLTAIRLFSETLERSQDDPKTQEECIKMLSSETERLSRHIERLLDWGRMEAGRKTFDMQPTPVGEIVKNVTDAFSPLRTDAALVFEAQVDDGLPEVYGDRDALTDAIVNLLSNARKYGGTPPIVSLRVYRDDKERIAFEVKDNGAGIPRAFHSRIFDKFYRIDDRLSRAREGSGLGLAIVKHIVRAHRGRVVVESSPGKGSTFRILLAPVPKLALKTEPHAKPSAEGA
jgi:two-component system phosphate regulon sensor histidine kinase PhoR